MKLLMENWRKFVKVEQDADEANELINEAVSQFLSSNSKLLKEFIGPGNPLYDGDEEEEDEEEEEEEEEEADEVIDSVEDEMIDTISSSPDADEEEEEEEEVDTDVVTTSMTQADTSYIDQATADAEEFVAATAGRLGGYIIGTAKTLAKMTGKAVTAIVDTAVGGAEGLRDLFPKLARGATDIVIMFPEAAQEVVKNWKDGKDVKELAETNPEGFREALKTLEERIFDLELPGVKDANTAAIFLHQSKKGPRSAKKEIKKAIKNAATESELSTSEILGLLAAYTAFSSHAAKVASKQAQEVEDS